MGFVEMRTVPLASLKCPFQEEGFANMTLSLLGQLKRLNCLYYLLLPPVIFLSFRIQGSPASPHARGGGVTRQPGEPPPARSCAAIATQLDALLAHSCTAALLSSVLYFFHSMEIAPRAQPSPSRISWARYLPPCHGRLRSRPTVAISTQLGALHALTPWMSPSSPPSSECHIRM